MNNEFATSMKLAKLAAREASNAILSFYRKNLEVDIKANGSPLTMADLESHRICADILSETGDAFVSEEGETRFAGSLRYWLVDPLDGAKDFIAGNDEFSVNISLIAHGRPVLGVIYAPAKDELYAGIPGDCAWQELRGRKTQCRISPAGPKLRMAKSRFHDHPDANAFAVANSVEVQVPIGSALKYGRLAMAAVDVYPRLVGTSEWDTAAGQAVLEAAGGQILDWHSGKPLRYGKPGRRNGRFIAFRSPFARGDFVYQAYEPGLL